MRGYQMINKGIWNVTSTKIFWPSKSSFKIRKFQIFWRSEIFNFKFLIFNFWFSIFDFQFLISNFWFPIFDFFTEFLRIFYDIYLDPKSWTIRLELTEQILWKSVRRRVVWERIRIQLGQARRRHQLTDRLIGLDPFDHEFLSRQCFNPHATITPVNLR